MTKEYIDRSELLQGVNQLSRDYRIPYNYPRQLENFKLTDGRPRRRKGFTSLRDPVKTQALCKHTGTGFSKRLLESRHNKGTIATTPLSYGLIRHQEELQLKRSENKTIEFCFKLGDLEEYVRNPFSRVAHDGANWNNHVFRAWGVYLLDQTILSNGHIFDSGFITDGAFASVANYDMTAAASATQFDALPLTSMAFSYSQNSIVFEFGMMEIIPNFGTYWRGILSYTIPTYVVGEMYHVAVVWDNKIGFGTISLYVNGTLAEKIDMPADAPDLVFAGEQDYINGVYEPRKRDIVLLNECTARASYSSACKIRGDMHGHQTFFHDFSNSPNVGIAPWALSPPRGTAMWDLRVWTLARDEADIRDNQFQRLISEGDMTGNWWLDDGGPVCVNHVDGKEKWYCSLHHGYPGYIKETGFLNGLGVKLGEGQHLIKSVTKNDALFGSGFAAQLGNFLDPNVSGTATLFHRDQHSFSVMMQIMVPDSFQQELNDDAAAPLSMKDITLVGEARRSMNTGCFADYDSLLDGEYESSALARSFVGHATDPAIGPDIQQHLRAYDQTLWSIEGTQRTSDSEGVTSENDRRRIPIARGVLTPAGKVAFELFKKQSVGQPKYLRLLSATALAIGSIYTITFVQRPNYVYNGGTNELDASGWRIEIWLQNITAGTAAVLSSSYTVAAASLITTGALQHEKNYDITIGASYVNDGWDHSVQMPFPGGVVATPKTSYNPAPSLTSRANHGPWPVQQRFMSPYQDQPGNFIIGMFRLWSIAIPSGLIAEYGNSKILAKNQTVDLLANLEFDSITGTVIPNRSRYPDDFRMGFKGWGMPQGYRNITYLTVATTAYLKKELFEGTWAYEDCLGYTSIDEELYLTHHGSRTRVNGILPFKSSFGKQYGVLSVHADSIEYDENLDNQFTPLFLTNQGMLSEFVQNAPWRGTVIGDRTILTSEGALPKVFNGKTCTIAGFKRWSGGSPVVYETASPIAGITNGWYGVAILYFSEEYGIYQVSPVSVVKVTTTNAIGVFMVPHHPDPRVTVVEVYRTLPQATRSLAESAPLYKTEVKSSVTGAIVGIAGGNIFSEALVIEQPDSLLSPVVLDRNVTEFPACSFSAALNNRLFLAGDLLNSDTIFYTDPGNPERIDSYANSIRLPEGSGDAMTGMLAEYGALFVFKPNAIWRVDDIGGNRFQLLKVANIGPVSPESLRTIVNPDTGAVVIFFWSEFGPYMFDGNVPRYVGAQLETELGSRYAWLNPSSVVVGHDADSREIICFYAPIRYGPTVTDPARVSTQLSLGGEAWAFNYRRNSWAKYTGTICSSALSLNFSSSSLSVDPSSRSLVTNDYRLLLGGTNGRLYSWGTADYDGLPSGLVVTLPYTVTSVISFNEIIVGLLPNTHDLTGLWVTLVDPITGMWMTGPIDWIDPITTKITLNDDWIASSSQAQAIFAATSGDLTGYQVYLCNPPSYVEFPWDELGVPFFEKDIVELLTWHDGDFKYRTRDNYLPLTVYQWKPLSSSASMRKRTQLKKNVEALKLELMSFAFGATLEGFAYNAHFKKGANTFQ